MRDSSRTGFYAEGFYVFRVGVEIEINPTLFLHSFSSVVSVQAPQVFAL